MFVWYVFSTILIVLSVIALVQGVYLLCRGVLKKDVEAIAYAAVRMVYVGVTVLLFWMIDLALGFDLGWIKVLVTEHATTLKFVAGILFCTVGVPLIFIIIALIKFLFIDTRQTVNKTSSEDNKEREG